jgi:hypothetical protein
MKRRGRFGFDPLKPPHGAKQKLSRQRRRKLNTVSDATIAQLEQQWRDHHFLVPARAGEWDWLAIYCRLEFPPTPAMLQFLADVLDGKETRAANAPPATAQNLMIGAFVEMVSQTRHNPVAWVAEKLRMTQRTVSSARAAYLASIRQPGELSSYEEWRAAHPDLLFGTHPDLLPGK